jgi:two-component system, NtrC family, sensor kinase
MVLAVVGIVGTAVWSSALERDAALADFSNEQAAVAAAIMVDFDHRLNLHLSSSLSAPNNDSKGGGGEPILTDDVILELLSGARRLEERAAGRDVMVLVARPGGQSAFLTTDHRVISSRRLREALDRGASTVILPRDEAVAFGLPRRAAVAGLASVRTGHHRDPWALVVVASAYRLRIRQRNEQLRLGLTAGIVTVLVLVVGGVMQRRERRQLDLEREVAIAGLEREREAALAKADKMAALAALSTGIAHEVGTPLSIIVERVDQLRERLSPTDERAVVVLRIVTEQVERIQRIVQASLALARGDSPRLVEVEPLALAGRATALVRHRFHKANVELESKIDDGLPKIACEPSLFEQALVNLLLNACEASPEGGRVTLSVGVTRRGNNSGQEVDEVEFLVDDAGEGISEHARERATEPFFSTKRMSGGSGLGLTIAREIVLHHAGTLTLESRGEVGTRARIAIRAT